MTCETCIIKDEADQEKFASSSLIFWAGILTEYVLPAALPKFEHKTYEFDPTLAKAAVGKYINAVDDL